MSAVTFCTADIQVRVDVEAVLGCAAVRERVGGGLGVATADGTVGCVVSGIDGRVSTEKSFATTWLNLAMTAIGPDPESRQRPRPEHAPAQPSNREPGAG